MDATWPCAQRLQMSRHRSACSKCCRCHKAAAATFSKLHQQGRTVCGCCERHGAGAHGVQVRSFSHVAEAPPAAPVSASLSPKRLARYRGGRAQSSPYTAPAVCARPASLGAVPTGHVRLHLPPLTGTALWPGPSGTHSEPHSGRAPPGPVAAHGSLSAVSTETWSEPVPGAAERRRTCHLIPRSLGVVTCKVRARG